MGSNKRHKSDKNKESKKKRHRSRSRSYSPDPDKSERHRHHKKHKRKERKDYDSDVEIVTTPPPPPKISKNHDVTPPPPEISRPRTPSPPARSSGSGGNSTLSMSIEESNRIRAKLGLKPLEVNAAPSKDDPAKIKDDLGEFYHKPAQNVAEKVQTEKVRERINVQKQKRMIETNLSKIRTLGDDDSDEDALAWIEKNRQLQEEKKKAELRAKQLDQLDEEFGIGDLVKEEVRNDRRAAYSDKDLRGLKVEHNIETFAEGQTVILTLQDKGVLDEGNDVLVNVNLRDDEVYHRNVKNKLKKPGYDAYDEDHFDEFGLPKNQVLEKYDEEIEGEKKQSFILGIDSAKEVQQRRSEIVKQRLANKRLESLKLQEPKLASEYYNEDELAKFKKRKKKVRKIRQSKTLKADDLVPDSTDYLRDLGSRRRKKPEETKVKADVSDALDVADYELPSRELLNAKIEEDKKEPVVSRVLSKKNQMKDSSSSFNETLLNLIKNEPSSEEKNISGNITLNATAEFCRTLGEIPTYGLAGNREDDDREMMDFEYDEPKEEPVELEDPDDGRGAWNTVKLDEVKREPVTLEAAILDAEPSLGQGLSGALRVAMSKGYLDQEDSNRPSASRFAHLQAQNYSIEDKTYGDDDKFGRRDRFNGPSSDFKEKEGFKPNVKLEYIDDEGHVLSSKEAFRYLSHKFHGKGPGKNKVEKRMKKAEQEVLMKRMSSTDTPLGTLNLLQAKQKETQSPFIVLSGNKHMQATSISKTKH
ncbi:GSCOCG00003982001-RA-CDS [Cotesia congregata]|uniref:Similar to SART1: U4/U6.U5 tri-snRNP-associated protein 1 (Homo sapiens) n=1 Tax=Cotesia congregata TaxID=51543 RepID=A0A8J2H7J8_COTCN|nr:GSCOCG00003982001-RA-CDS [Cotesia congregata]CAG5081786.1 Similar to SART1: U4/U6.U5 tri-snRNP-associated protein 1 (Homo sapiens) [Cotesia congregata]